MDPAATASNYVDNSESSICAKRFSVRRYRAVVALCNSQSENLIFDRLCKLIPGSVSSKITDMGFNIY